MSYVNYLILVIEAYVFIKLTAEDDLGVEDTWEAQDLTVYEDFTVEDIPF